MFRSKFFASHPDSNSSPKSVIQKITPDESSTKEQILKNLTPESINKAFENALEQYGRIKWLSKAKAEFRIPKDLTKDNMYQELSKFYSREGKDGFRSFKFLVTAELCKVELNQSAPEPLRNEAAQKLILEFIKELSKFTTSNNKDGLSPEDIDNICEDVKDLAGTIWSDLAATREFNSNLQRDISSMQQKSHELNQSLQGNINDLSNDLRELKKIVNQESTAVQKAIEEVQEKRREDNSKKFEEWYQEKKAQEKTKKTKSTTVKSSQWQPMQQPVERLTPDPRRMKK